MADENLKYVFTVDEKGLVKGIENSTKAFKKLDSSSINSTSSLGKMNDSLDRTARKASSAGNLMKKAFIGIGAYFGARMVYDFAKSSISIASNLAEIQNVVDVTFGSMSSRINEFALSAAKGYGLSELSAKKYAGTMGAMLKSMGLGTSKATDMSIEMAKLAGDFASFYNLDSDEAFSKIRSGISGETEPLKQLGINMSVANLEAYALSQGITTGYASMNQQNQSLTRMNYLLSVSKDAQGDFSRTSSSWANQTRILSLQFDSFKANLGSAFIAVLAPLLQGLNNLMATLISASAQVKSFFDSLGGSKTSTNIGKTISSSTDQASAGLDGMAASADSANKAMNSLAGFDKLNVLTQDAPASTNSRSDTSSSTSSPVNTEESKAIISVNSALWSGYFETIKATVMSFVESTRIGFQIVNSIFLGAWDNGGKYLFDNIVAFGVKLIEFAGFINTQYIIPLQTWFRDNLAPVIGVALGAILKVVGDVFNALTSSFNWLMTDGKPVLDTIILVVGSFATAFLLVNGAIAAYNFIMGIGAVVTGITTSAAWALSAAIMFITSPIGIAVAAVAAMIAIGVLLYKNWGTITTFAGNLWKNIQSIFGKIGSFIGDIWKGIVNGFIGVVNTVIGGVNTMIKGFLSPFNALIKGWNNTIGKITGKITEIEVVIPTIKQFADGGVAFGPTLGMFAEYANARSNPEVVAPLDRLKSMLGSNSDPEQIALLREQNQLLRDLYNKDNSTYLDGEVINKNQNDRSKREARIKGYALVG